jgi:hypothetical protein
MIYSFEGLATQLCFLGRVPAAQDLIEIALYSTGRLIAEDRFFLKSKKTAILT